jgi:hypothetical protein
MKCKLILLALLVFGLTFVFHVRDAFAQQLCMDASMTSCVTLPLSTCTVVGQCGCIPDSTDCSGSPSEVCYGASGGWDYQYNGTCVREEDTGSGCAAFYFYEYNSCSAADRCSDSGAGNVSGACGGDGGTGNNSNGAILAGVCNASGCPGVGCQNGGWYKTCCNVTDTDSSGGVTAGDQLIGTSGGCSSGLCPGSSNVCVRAVGCDATKSLDVGPDAGGCWTLEGVVPPTDSCPYTCSDAGNCDNHVSAYDSSCGGLWCCQNEGAPPSGGDCCNPSVCESSWLSCGSYGPATPTLITPELRGQTVYIQWDILRGGEKVVSELDGSASSACGNDWCFDGDSNEYCQDEDYWPPHVAYNPFGKRQAGKPATGAESGAGFDGNSSERFIWGTNCAQGGAGMSMDIWNLHQAGADSTVLENFAKQVRFYKVKAKKQSSADWITYSPSIVYSGGEISSDLDFMEYIAASGSYIPGSAEYHPFDSSVIRLTRDCPFRGFDGCDETFYQKTVDVHHSFPIIVSEPGTYDYQVIATWCQVVNGSMYCQDGDPGSGTFNMPSYPPEVVMVDPSAGNINSYIGSGRRVDFITTYHDDDDMLSGPSNNMVSNSGFEFDKTGWEDPAWAAPWTEAVSDEKKFGNRSMHLWATGIDYVRKSQWFLVNSNTTYTLKAWGKNTNSAIWANVRADEYNAINTFFGSHQLSFTQNFWEENRVVFTTSGSTTQIAVTMQYGLAGNGAEPAGDFYVDGITVQQGNHDGIYTDIDMAQLNLGTGNDASTWPIRVMYTNHWDSRTVSDNRFYIQEKYNCAVVPGTNYCYNNGSTVSYDSVLDRWYLDNSLTTHAVGVNDTVATLLGGVNGTYIYFVNGDVVINWAIQFEDGYLADGTYDEILYVSDISGLQDTYDDDGAGILHQQVIDGTANFWDLGDFVFETPKYGTISGYIYDDLDGGADDVCVDTTAAMAGWTVTCSGNGIDGVIDEANISWPANITGPNSYECVTSSDSPDLLYGHYLVSFSPTTTYSHDTCGGAVISANPREVIISDEYVAAGTSEDFHQDIYSRSWFQIMNGFGHINTGEGFVGDALENDIPFLDNGGFIVDDGAFTIAHGSYSFEINQWGDEGSFAEAGDYGGIVAEYSWFDKKLRDHETSMLTLGSDYTVANSSDLRILRTNGTGTESLIINEGNVTSGNLVIIHDGYVTINGDITVDSDAGFLLIASGNITIDGDVDNLQGIYIAGEYDEVSSGFIGGTIVFDVNNDLTPKIDVQGVIIAWNTIEINRGYEQNIESAIEFTYRDDIINSISDVKYIKVFNYAWGFNDQLD